MEYINYFVHGIPMKNARILFIIRNLFAGLSLLAFIGLFIMLFIPTKYEMFKIILFFSFFIFFIFLLPTGFMTQQLDEDYFLANGDSVLSDGELFRKTRQNRPKKLGNYFKFFKRILIITLLILLILSPVFWKMSVYQSTFKEGLDYYAHVIFVKRTHTKKSSFVSDVYTSVSRWFSSWFSSSYGSSKSTFDPKIRAIGDCETAVRNKLLVPDSADIKVLLVNGGSDGGSENDPYLVSFFVKATNAFGVKIPQTYVCEAVCENEQCFPEVINSWVRN